MNRIDLPALRAALNAYPRRNWALDQDPDGDEGGHYGYVDSSRIIAPSTDQEIAGGAGEAHEIGELYPVAASRLAVEAVNALPALLAIAEAAVALTRSTGGAAEMSHHVQAILAAVREHGVTTAGSCLSGIPQHPFMPSGPGGTCGHAFDPDFKHYCGLPQAHEAHTRRLTGAGSKPDGGEPR